MWEGTRLLLFYINWFVGGDQTYYSTLTCMWVGTRLLLFYINLFVGGDQTLFYIKLWERTSLSYSALPVMWQGPDFSILL